MIEDFRLNRAVADDVVLVYDEANAYDTNVSRYQVQGYIGLYKWLQLFKPLQVVAKAVEIELKVMKNCWIIYVNLITMSQCFNSIT